MTDRPLTPRQQRFVQEYLVDLNATQAAIRAGYSARSAYSTGERLLRNAEVAAAVAAGNQAVLEKVAGSAEWIVERAIEIVKIGMAAVPVRDRKGNVIEDADGDPAAYEAHDLKAANSALALLAKRHREFSDKQEHSGPEGQPIAIVSEGRLGNG